MPAARLSRVSVLLLALLLAIASLAGCKSAPAATSRAVKLLVDADGVYQVAASDLAGAGFVLKGLRPEQIALSAGGQPVAFQIARQGRDTVFRFYGQALGPEAHTGTNVYWLTRTDAQAEQAAARPAGSARPESLTIQSRAAAPPMTAATLTQVVTHTLTVEEQRQYRPLALPGEPQWIWENLYAPGETQVKFAVPNLAPGDSLLSIYLVGNSSAEVDPDHHLLVKLNGQPVADSTWDGTGPHAITATVAAGTLTAGENVLALALPGDTGAAADAVLLDRVEVRYPRELALDREALRYEAAAPGYAIKIKEQPAVVWDITAPLRPVELTGYTMDDGLLRLSGDQAAAQRYIMATKADLRKPAVVPAADGPDLWDWPGGADLIIVTVPQFHDALQPLIKQREQQGLRVAVVDVGQVYDAFTAGRAEPEAIRLLVQQALAGWTSPSPRFLLLAGDASYDPRGYLKGSEVDLVPSGSVHTSYSGWAASDVWYAVPNDQAGVPALAVGRLPSQTPGQMAAMVSKTLAYENASPAADTAADWRAASLLVADNDEPGFAEEARAFAAALQGYQTEQVTIEGDATAARDRLLSTFDAGAGLIGYFGHGSLTLWAQEKVFGIDDVGKLANRDRLPIVFTVTCLSGFFDHPSTPSLGETLVRAEQGGAVAALVPSSAGVLGDQSALAQSLAAALSAARTTGQPGTLGEVVLRSQAALPAGQAAREILLTFNLLGDPSLRLPR